jgi:PAS domain S-box-containing protein
MKTRIPEDKPFTGKDGLVVSLNRVGEIRFFGPKMQKLTGYARGEVVGRSWADLFVPPEYRSEFKNDFEAIMRGKEAPFVAEYPILLKRGRSGPIYWASSLLWDVRRQPKSLLSVGHPAGGALAVKYEEGWARRVLNSLADGIFTVDRDLKITFFSDTASRITGWRPEEVVNRVCCEVLCCNACGDCPLKRWGESVDQSLHCHTEIRARADRSLPAIIRFSPWIVGDGSFGGGVASFGLHPLPAGDCIQGAERRDFHGMISRNGTMQELFSILPKIADSKGPVHITGETGTGKELFASAIHQLSSRRNGPLVRVNCGAIPENLLESELFGYKQGAFTDARKDKPGRFKLAEGGTLFLDEIGTLPASVQSKLLRVLESEEYDPLGATETERVDVRIISATNRDLLALIKAGQFREDLYYRLSLFTLKVPPLRERKTDIPILIEHFLEHLTAEHERRISGFSPEAMNVLLTYDYPGNVRELRNFVEYAYTLCPGPFVEPDSLPAGLVSGTAKRAKGGAAGREGDGTARELIGRTLKKHNGRVKEASAHLHISRVTLWRKRKRLGLLSVPENGDE